MTDDIPKRCTLDWLIVGMLLTIGVVITFKPTVLSGFRFMQTDPGDPWFNNYVLEHGFQWIIGTPLHSDFWSPPFFWPAQDVAAYSDILLGAAPIYWAFRIIGFLPDTSFQLWTIALFVLNYFLAILLFRRGLGLSLISSGGGAYIFAFANVRITELVHPQLLPQFYSLLAIFCLIKLSQNQSTSRSKNLIWALGFSACVVLQFYSGFYLGWLLCLGMGTFIVLFYFGSEGRCIITAVVRRNWISLLVSSGLAMLALSWMAVHYAQTYSQVGPRGWEEVLSYIPRIKWWIFMGPNTLYAWMPHYINFGTLPYPLGMGFLTLCTCAYGLAKYAKKPWVQSMTIGSLIIFLSALVYPSEVSPWQFVWKVIPGASAIRVVYRLVLLLLIPVCLGVAFGLESIRKRRIVVAMLILLCLEHLHYTPYYDKFQVRAEVERIVATIPKDCDSFYYAKIVKSLPESMSEAKCQLLGMWAGLIARKPTLNGYSGNFPKDWPLRNSLLKSKLEVVVTKEKILQWADLMRLRPSGIAMPWGDETQLPNFFHALNVGGHEKLSLEFGTPFTRACLVAGWSQDEPSHVWAIGKRSVMCVPLEPDSSYDMDLTVSPFSIPDVIQKVVISLNDATVTKLDLSPERTTYRIKLSPSLMKEMNKLVFNFAYADSPANLGLSPDSRNLSVAFHKIEFTKLQ